MPSPLLWHSYLRPAQVAHDLETAARIDPFGDRVHLLLGLAWCFFLGWPTSVVEIASIPLLVFFALRTPKIWRTWGSFAVQPLSLAIAAWVLWQALSLFWSPDPRQGLKELSANRWVWVIWVLWPLMAHRPRLIWAVAIGFLCGNLAQLGHALGKAFELPWLVWPRLPNRNSGWWDPVVGGSLLVGVLGLHLPAAVMGRGLQRILAVGGAAITLIAIMATGTRGAWVAAGLLIIGVLKLAAIVWLVQRRGEPAQLRSAAITAAVVAFAAMLGGILVKDTIIQRYSQGRAEVARALEQQDYSSDTGRRILMWKVAAAAVASHPLQGVGAGGYQRWGQRYLVERQQWTQQKSAEAIHAHAHSASLHIAATTGIVGFLLAAIIVALAVYGGLTQLGARGLGSYAAGPAVAIAGQMLVGVFDPVHLNAQTSALLATLMAFCLLSRPATA